MGRRLTINMPDEHPDSVAARVVRQLTEQYPSESPAEVLARMPDVESQKWLGTLKEQEAAALEYQWEFWARPKQRIPTSKWKVLMYMSGRGFGKTRSAAEVVRHWIESGQKKHVALIAATAADVRDTVIEAVYKQGSGLMQICPPWNMPHYSPTKKTLTWDNPNYKSNGAVCSLYSAEKPQTLRGPSHDGAWLDEFCKFKYGETVYDMLKFTMRLGDNPQIVISTTPAPVSFLLDLIDLYERQKAHGIHDIIIVRGSTYENQSNLSSDFIADIQERYEGTNLGRQEIHADIVMNMEGALWSYAMIDSNRLKPGSDGVVHQPPYNKVIVSVDPQTGYTPEQKGRRSKGLTGIIVAATGFSMRGQPPHAYVLADYSINGKPEEWAKRVVDAYNFFDADLILAETNQGGKMVESVIRAVDPSVRIQVVSAQTKKDERAIPVVAKYQQGRVHHVGVLSDLESECLTYCPGDEDRHRSPNRMDALTWAIRHLLISGGRAAVGVTITRRI